MKAVNLLPPDMRGAGKKPASAERVPAAPAPGGAGPLVVLGVLALAVVAVAAYVLTGNQIKDRKAELASAQAAHAETMAQVNALKPYADFATMATARVATVNALAQSRFDWEQALRDLSRALPSDVHLTALKGDLGAATAGGTSGLRGSITAPAISLQGCTRTHSDVARLMSRLRNVRGVTRVSLASSTKAETAAAPSSLGGTNGEQPAQLCPKGEPPSFDLVVFFEGSNAVPASSAGVPATSTPAGTSTPANGAAAPAATPAPGATPAPTATPAAGAATTQPASSTSTTGAP